MDPGSAPISTAPTPPLPSIEHRSSSSPQNSTRPRRRWCPTPWSLARRGFVTITVGPYNQGNSSKQPAHSKAPAIKLVIDYATRTHTLNYVDTSRVGIIGHSAGGSRVRRTAAIYGAKESKALEKAKTPDSPGGTTITTEDGRETQPYSRCLHRRVVAPSGR